MSYTPPRSSQLSEPTESLGETLDVLESKLSRHAPRLTDSPRSKAIKARIEQLPRTLKRQSHIADETSADELDLTEEHPRRRSHPQAPADEEEEEEEEADQIDHSDKESGTPQVNSQMVVFLYYF